MSLTDKINGDIKAAMLAKDKERLGALRAIKTAILNELTKDGSSEISEDAGIKILQKLHKQRKDSAQIYIDQDRVELAEEELSQAKVIAEYLPEQMNEEELKTIIADIITTVGASGPQDMGKVMGAANKQLAGKAEGRLIAACVKQLLNNN